MRKYDHGIFKPKNMSRYSGNKLPEYRSSWERAVFIWLDTNPNVLKWSSETIKIPYQNPFNGRINNYIPDILVSYKDGKGKTHTELIEIKPLAQTSLAEAKSRSDKASVILNHAKWQAAEAWAKSNRIKFRIMTEMDIFAKPRGTSKRKPKRRKR